MPNQNEEEKRKQILKDLKAKQLQAFEASLPISRALFKGLFEYLDEQLENEGCDDTLRLTEQFLQDAGVVNIEEVLQWLRDHGGYCDCEVLANVEEQFKGWNISYYY
jgi:hypothetical protein